VLVQLADILSIDPDSTKEEVSRLIQRCPELQIDSDAGGEKENHVILMVCDNVYIFNGLA